MSSNGRDFSRPRTYGTMQYEQKLLQPMVMGSHAAHSCSRAVGSSVGNEDAASSTST